MPCARSLPFLFIALRRWSYEQRENRFEAQQEDKIKSASHTEMNIFAEHSD